MNIDDLGGPTDEKGCSTADFVFRVPVPKAQLRAIPLPERNFLLLASHAVNQLTTLRKLVIFSTNYEPDDEVEQLLSAGQSQTILRFLFGAVAEAWELIKRPSNQKIIGKDYRDLMEDDGKQLHAALKMHFGKSNLLNQIRNTISYHYPNDSVLEAAFEEVPENEDWAWYPSNTLSNSFYLASDWVVSAGVLRLTGVSDPAEAFGIVMDTAMKVSEDMVDFFLFIMRAIVIRHLGESALIPAPGSGHPINGAPGIRKVVIPFFTSKDESGHTT